MQLRRLFDLSGCAFLVIDWEARHIHPAATWFASPAVREAFGVVLDRPYDLERPGITEAAVEQRAPLVVSGIEHWPGAAGLRERLERQLPPDQARLTWEWYAASSLLACPVEAPDGSILGVLTLAGSGFGEEQQHSASVFAGLAGIALERSALAQREEALTRAVGEVGASLELDDVHSAIVEQAARLSGASHVRLTRREPGGREPRTVVQTGAGQGPTTRVPLSIGAREFGVLELSADGEASRLDTFAPAAAGAIANALDFARERRIALALARGFVPGPLPELEGFDAGLVHQPSGQAAGGGDFFGIWRLPDGEVALLVGDVSGKGIEVAAVSAMVRFFIEARTFDAADPATVLAQTNRLLRGRLTGTTFVPAVLMVVDDVRVRWCNAGHVPPVLLPAGGGARELEGTGLPLGVEEDAPYAMREAPLGPGDVIFACTDGLTEARRDGVQFGDARLAALLESARDAPAAELVLRAQREAEAWAGSLDDDVVILAVRRWA